MFRLLQQPPGIFSNRVGLVSGSAKRAGFWRYDPSDKSSQALCTSKVIEDLDFLEITSLLGFSNATYCDGVCCSVLQCAAVCCSVLQCVAVWCSVLQCVAMCHFVACLVAQASFVKSAPNSSSQPKAFWRKATSKNQRKVSFRKRTLHVVDLRKSLSSKQPCNQWLFCRKRPPKSRHQLECVAVCWRVLQCVVVCCNVYLVACLWSRLGMDWFFATLQRRLCINTRINTQSEMRLWSCFSFMNASLIYWLEPTRNQVWRKRSFDVCVRSARAHTHTALFLSRFLRPWRRLTLTHTYTAKFATYIFNSVLFYFQQRSVCSLMVVVGHCLWPAWVALFRMQVRTGQPCSVCRNFVLPWIHRVIHLNEIYYSNVCGMSRI